MAETAAPPMVRCAYRPQCLNSFPERGPKRYCCTGHRAKASHKRTGRRKVDSLRLAAIERDGGCVRRLRPEQIKSEDELYNMGGEERSDYEHAYCLHGKLLVRLIDRNKPRTLENVETLCRRHFGMRSDEQFRERLGPERYRETKKVQARHYHRMGAMMRKMVRIYKGPPKNPLDYIDHF